MKRTWLLRLTPEQFTKLHKGLHSQFRFYLNLAFETVVYNPNNYCLTIHLPSGNGFVCEQVSAYINGFALAIYP
jgi:hypothetical protein